MHILAGQLLGYLKRLKKSGGGFFIDYLLRDDFLTPAAAPLASPRTCEPGPGALIVTDGNNKLSISGGRLSFATGGVGSGNPGVWSSAPFTRVVGLAVMAEINTTGSNTAVDTMRVGFDLDTSGAITDAIQFLDASRIVVASNAAVAAIGAATWAINTSYYATVVQRAIGSLYIIRMGTQWTLLWVSFVVSANGYAAMSVAVANSTFSSDTLRVINLPAPYTTDYGIATDLISSPTVGSTITSEADAVIEMTWTAVTGQTWELSVRYTDDSNRWCIRSSQSGSTIKLIQIQAGVETERSSAAQTFTNGIRYRVVAICSGQAVRTYVNNTARNTYTSASFNQTATGVKTDRAGVDLVAWPRVLSGEAAAVLEAVIA